MLVIYLMQAIDPDEVIVFMRAGGWIVIVDDFGYGDRLLVRF